MSIRSGVVVFFKSGGRHPFDAVTGLPAGFGSAAVLLTLVGFVLGATLVGADYASRALTTLFTWEPRRSRVLAARAAACATVAGCASLAALALLCLVLLPAAIAHGSGPALTGSWYVSMAGLALRCALLAAATSAIGVSCAAIGRSTPAALAIIVVYWIAVERTAIGIGTWLSRWLFVALARSWVAGGPLPLEWHVSWRSRNRSCGRNVRSAVACRRRRAARARQLDAGSPGHRLRQPLNALR